MRLKYLITEFNSEDDLSCKIFFHKSILLYLFIYVFIDIASTSSRKLAVLVSPTQKQGGPSGASPQTALPGEELELEPGDEGDVEEEDEADKAEGSTSGRSRSRYVRPVLK